MHVDRARFLVLTTTMAASGCGSGSEAARSEVPREPATAPVVDVPGALPDQVLVAEPQDGPGTAGTAWREPGGPARVPEVEPAPELQPLPQVPAGIDTPEQGAVLSLCRSLRPPPGPQCESFDTTPGECETYARVLEPPAAERAARCLQRKSGTQAICQFGVTAKCFLEGARGTPTGPAADRPCAALLKQCAGARWREPDVTAANCSAAVSAVRPRYQPLLISCMSEGCGIANCFYSLSP